MLKKWTVKNFKSIYEKTSIDLAPLTIFAGANSSGKSTVIQSLLLTAQTVQSPVHSKSVVLNGHILRLGAYDDVVSNTREKESIEISFELAPTSGIDDPSGSRVPVLSLYGSDLATLIENVECAFSFGTNGGAGPDELLQLQPQLDQSKIRISIRDSEAADEEIAIQRATTPVEIRAAKFQLTHPQPAAADLSSLKYEVIKPATLRSGKRYSRIGLAVSGKSAGAILVHFLPYRISIVFDAVEEQTNALFEAILNPRERRYDRDFAAASERAFSETLRNLLLQLLRESISAAPTANAYVVNRAEAAVKDLERQFDLRNYLRAAATLPPAAREVFAVKVSEHSGQLKDLIRGQRPPQFLLTHAPLPTHLEFGVDYVRNYFTTSVKYLGPLRDEPKPVYPLAGATDPSHVGFRGEHTAAVLDVYKNTLVDYLPTATSVELPNSPQARRVSLISAVSDWLAYMGVVDEVATLDKGKLGHELKVATRGNEALHDLTHVGVGVSQVLPILVLSLLAARDSTLIFEQPELHLHPRVQTRLAEFFVSMTKLGKQCIVETHSEYLINRLRYLSAVGEGRAIADNVVIYFVENHEGHSHYRPIRISEFGVIPDWPKGFFDENEENSAALLRAAMEKRKRSATRTDAHTSS
jgi:predicted ATPase